VRALPLRDGVSDVLAPEAARQRYGRVRDCVGRWALRCETLSKLASENSVAEESSSVRAEGYVRTRCVRASGL
jgi:hypothetical protein